MKGEIKNPVKNLKSIKTTKIIERRNKSIERNHFYSNWKSIKSILWYWF